LNIGGAHRVLFFFKLRQNEELHTAVGLQLLWNEDVVVEMRPSIFGLSINATFLVYAKCGLRKQDVYLSREVHAET
jgi:hypothetical protein